MVFIVAAIRLTPALVRAGASALLVFGAPHTIFHSFHLDHMSAAEGAAQTVTTSFLTLVLPTILFLIAGRLDRREIEGKREGTLRSRPYANQPIGRF